jgi:hypothetical protein
VARTRFTSAPQSRCATQLDAGASVGDGSRINWVRSAAGLEETGFLLWHRAVDDRVYSIGRGRARGGDIDRGERGRLCSVGIDRMDADSNATSQRSAGRRRKTGLVILAALMASLPTRFGVAASRCKAPQELVRFAVPLNKLARTFTKEHDIRIVALGCCDQ